MKVSWKKVSSSGPGQHVTLRIQVFAGSLFPFRPIQSESVKRKNAIRTVGIRTAVALFSHRCRIALLAFAHLTFALLSHSHCWPLRTVGIRTVGFALVSFALLSFALLSYKPVRPVNSDFDIFIRILFYLNKKWREDARKLSRPRHGLVNTKQLPLVLKLDLYSSFFFFFFWGGGRSSPNEMAYFAGIVWSQFVSDFKNKHTVAKPFSLPKREWVVCENTTRKWLRDGRSKLADISPLTTPREKTVTRPNLRASFEVILCPILQTNTPLQRPCN